MQHFFFIEENNLKAIQRLFENKLNYQYVVLCYSDGYCDIAQYVDKYQNVKIITVQADKLDKSKELVI